MTMTSTAIIADDHSLVRAGIRSVLEQIDGVKVVAEAKNGLEAIALSKQHRPALLTLDVQMPLSQGMEAYGEVRRWSPKTRIAVVTALTAPGQLAGWSDVGADGIFLKSCDPAVMREGIRAVLSGETYIEPTVAQILRDAHHLPTLSRRERQTLHLICDGFTNAQIAIRLSISPKTVDNHRTRLMAKLGVHSVSQLIAKALHEGLIDKCPGS